MQDLGRLGGTGESSATGINDLGQVVGQINTATAQHAFFYADGIPQDIGTLGGPNSLALGINSAGQVVGWAHTASFNTHAFLWDSGTMSDLNQLIPPGSCGCVLAQARGINDAGQIVATGNLTGGGFHAFLLSLQ